MFDDTLSLQKAMKLDALSECERRWRVSFPFTQQKWDGLRERLRAIAATTGINADVQALYTMAEYYELQENGPKMMWDALCAVAYLLPSERLTDEVWNEARRQNKNK